ncbi:hypothetical protein [Streptomyces sp. NPDC058371]|uniref:hypothetical protein n=1 Tax=Streptomyces sp. NPDC058371 TaxID=3346463 RepID=UPI003662D472
MLVYVTGAVAIEYGRRFLEASKTPTVVAVTVLCLEFGFTLSAITTMVRALIELVQALRELGGHVGLHKALKALRAVDLRRLLLRVPVVGVIVALLAYAIILVGEFIAAGNWFALIFVLIMIPVLLYIAATFSITGGELPIEADIISTGAFVCLAVLLGGVILGIPFKLLGADVLGFFAGLIN